MNFRPNAVKAYSSKLNFLVAKATNLSTKLYVVINSENQNSMALYSRQPKHLSAGGGKAGRLRVLGFESQYGKKFQNLYVIQAGSGAYKARTEGAPEFLSRVKVSAS
jgi:hypothetical protein